MADSERDWGRFEVSFRSSFAFIVRDLGRVIVKDLEQRIEPYGITMPGWLVLRCVAEAEGLSQRELSQKLSVMETSAVEALQKLEQQGLVTRTKSLDDRRKIEVRLSKSGRALMDELQPHGQAVNDKIMGFGTPEEAALLLGMLQRVRAQFL